MLNTLSVGMPAKLFTYGRYSGQKASSKTIITKVNKKSVAIADGKKFDIASGRQILPRGQQDCVIHMIGEWTTEDEVALEQALLRDRVTLAAKKLDAYQGELCKNQVYVLEQLVSSMTLQMG